MVFIDFHRLALAVLGADSRARALDHGWQMEVLRGFLYFARRLGVRL